MDGFTYYNNNVNNSENDYEINEDEYLSFSLYMLSDDIKNFGKIKSNISEVKTKGTTKTEGNAYIEEKSNNNEELGNISPEKAEKSVLTTKKVKSIEIETYEINYNTPNELKKHKKKIFRIERNLKKNRRRGKLPNHLKNFYYVEHTKDGSDNIIRKIKISFINKVRDFINKKYEIYLMSQKKKNELLLARISPKNIIRMKKETNTKIFETTLKDLFSTDISSKYISKNKIKYKNFNKTQIDKLYKENKASSVIKVLNMKYKEMYEIYCNNLKLKGFEEMRNLEYDLMIRKRELYLKEQDEKKIADYLEKYKNTAVDLINIMEKKIPRKSYKNQ